MNGRRVGISPTYPLNCSFKELHSLERSMFQKQQERNQKAQKRHSLLHQCKLQSIDIPLHSGSLDQIMLDMELNTNNTGNVGEYEEI